MESNKKNLRCSGARLAVSNSRSLEAYKVLFLVKCEEVVAVRRLVCVHFPLARHLLDTWQVAKEGVVRGGGRWSIVSAASFQSDG